MANLCHFNVLFTRNVPHILEKIFLSLDYESYESAGNVSTVWYNLLTSKNYQRKAKIVHIELHKNFDGWSLAMIKDFIFCMDAAREKQDSKTIRPESTGEGCFAYCCTSGRSFIQRQRRQSRCSLPRLFT